MKGSDDLARRVERLEARSALIALKSRYWRAIDAGDADAVGECLADDAVVDFEGMPRFDDAASFLEVVRASAAAGGARHQHLGFNPVVEVRGADHAVARWDIGYRGVIDAPAMLVRMSGTYEDEYRREGGVWRIAAMTMRRTSFVAETVREDGAVVASLPAERTQTSEPEIRT